MPVSVINPGFEVDLSNWSKIDGDSSVTWTRDTAITNSGSAGSSKLVNTAAGADDYIFQDLNNLGLGLDLGHTYQVTAWNNVTSFTAGAVGNRGVFLSTFNAGLTATTTITAATAGWVRHDVAITLGSTDTGLEIRLYSPQGTAYWDDISMVDITPAPVVTRWAVRFNG